MPPARISSGALRHDGGGRGSPRSASPPSSVAGVTSPRSRRRAAQRDGHGAPESTTAGLGTSGIRTPQLGNERQSPFVLSADNVEGAPDLSRRSPTVSVIICAYTERRWSDLVGAVGSVAAQRPAPHEIIVVSDHNLALLERARRELPAAVVIANEQEQGLSGARNSGVGEARGEIIAFLDDDAVAAPDWLVHLVAPYDDRRVIGVGGTAEPMWPGARPAFMPHEFDWLVGCTYRGMPETTEPVRNLIGANMSLRRDVFDAVGGFRADVGRVGTRPVGCEETELCIRARQCLPRSEIIFEPRARVRHHVTPERANRRYFRARCWAEGLSKAVVARHAGRDDALSSERRYVTNTLPRGVAHGLRDAVLRREAGGLARAAWIVAGVTITAAGYAVGTVRAHLT
jgi:GT2 family glycosyltransferase